MAATRGGRSATRRSSSSGSVTELMSDASEDPGASSARASREEDARAIPKRVPRARPKRRGRTARRQGRTGPTARPDERARSARRREATRDGTPRDGRVHRDGRGHRLVARARLASVARRRARMGHLPNIPSSDVDVDVARSKPRNRFERRNQTRRIDPSCRPKTRRSTDGKTDQNGRGENPVVAPRARREIGTAPFRVPRACASRQTRARSQHAREARCSSSQARTRSRRRRSRVRRPRRRRPPRPGRADVRGAPSCGARPRILRRGGGQQARVPARRERPRRPRRCHREAPPVPRLPGREDETDLGTVPAVFAPV